MARMGKPEASIWILGDQLLEAHPAVAAAAAAHGVETVCVVMVESRRAARRLPYHRKKLTLLFAAMRHYAERLRAAGYAVDYRKAETFEQGLQAHAAEFGPKHLYTMAASSYRGRRFQHQLAEALRLPVAVLPNTQFLTGLYDPYPHAVPGKRYVMENFYRDMRRHFGLLLDGEGEPAGGQWNFDKENRKPLPRGLIPPELPRFAPDDITAEVMQELEDVDEGYGEVDGFDLAVTHEQAQAAFADFLTRRLADFGAYEDAMSREHATLFHAVVSPYLNLGLLEPLGLAQAAEAEYRAGRRANQLSGRLHPPDRRLAGVHLLAILAHYAGDHVCQLLARQPFDARLVLGWTDGDELFAPSAGVVSLSGATPITSNG